MSGSSRGCEQCGQRIRDANPFVPSTEHAPSCSLHADDRARFRLGFYLPLRDECLDGFETQLDRLTAALHLEKMAARLRAGDVEGLVLDMNGNAVGRWTLEGRD